ncbi:MAG: fused MFS/spermidine synthase [Patescibacteria group bacterium]|nr:fused MFS/spermidine synthase [Patescibacteria group bacterium]
MIDGKIIYETDTATGHYQVVDGLYNGRPSRVLYSGEQLAAQSGIALDAEDDLLFDYNQRLYELITGLLPKRMLIIGGGACTLPQAIQRDCPEIAVDIIEIDDGLIALACEYFSFSPTEHVTVHIGEGRKFLHSAAAQYDLIIVDAFDHDVTPQSFQTPEAANDLLRNLSLDGVVAYNCIASYYGKRSIALERTVTSLESVFNNVEVFPAANDISLWIPQNFLITARIDKSSLAQYLRFSPIL